MHIRHAIGFSAATAVALLAWSSAPVRGAGSTITGTVKAPGEPAGSVVVYVEKVPGTYKPGATPTIDQRQMQFTPHVLPVASGTTVAFRNSDPTQHNVFTPDHEKFNLGTWPQGESKNYTFDKCKQFPCAYTLLCRIHPEMEGYVLVLENPYFATTDAEGKYTIKDVPPGKYTVAAWDPKAKAAPKPVDVSGPSATVDFTLAK